MDVFNEITDGHAARLDDTEVDAALIERAGARLGDQLQSAAAAPCNVNSTSSWNETRRAFGKTLRLQMKNPAL